MARVYKFVLPTVAAMVLAGCLSPSRSVTTPARAPLGAEYATPLDDAAARGASTDTTAPSAPTNLTLRAALALGLLHNPGLQAYSHELRAAEARVLQARLPPNPKIEVELEEYDPGGDGMDAAETGVTLGQALELGIKRRSRIAVASAEEELVFWDFETGRLDVFAETARRFVNALAAQRRAGLLSSFAELAEKTARAVADRVGAGKDPAIQATKASAETDMARIAVLEAQSAVTVALRNLAARWGGEQAGFQSVSGSLDELPPSLPSPDAMARRLRDSPELARWDTMLRLRRAELADERAARVPDIGASAGIHHAEADGEDTLAFGIGLRLPLFNWNQGGVAAARHTLEKTRAEARDARVTLSVGLAVAHAGLVAAHMKARTLRDRVLPATEAASSAVKAGYEEGKFSYLELLDAQRAMFAAALELVDALADYHRGVIDIERITATSVDKLMDPEQEDKR